MFPPYRTPGQPWPGDDPKGWTARARGGLRPRPSPVDLLLFLAGLALLVHLTVRPLLPWRPAGPLYPFLLALAGLLVLQGLVHLAGGLVRSLLRGRPGREGPSPPSSP